MSLRSAHAADSIQSYARLAGILGLITFVAGGFGEAYAPGAIVEPGSAAATARNILAHESLFRWGFAGYLVEAFCDLGLAYAFWVLLRPAHRNLAFLMVLFRVVSTTGFASAQMLYFGALRVLRGADQLALAPDQLDALAFTLVRVASFGGTLFSGFYGAASIILGYLLVRSRLVPRILAVLMTIMGVAFVFQTFQVILAPTYAASWLLVTAVVAFVPLTLWLLIKGIDTARWRALAAS